MLRMTRTILPVQTTQRLSRIIGALRYEMHLSRQINLNGFGRRFRMPQEQLDLLIATKVEGRSQKDIAEKMGISVQAVKNRLLRAKMALRELFESEPE
jgi:DNA-binding NarL/FixJ family response regulator